MQHVEIRRVEPADQPALAAFYAELSRDSRRARFLGCGGSLDAHRARVLCCPDHVHDEGFVAVVADASTERRLVGHVCIVETGCRTGELAIAVADSLQGQGIGRRLFDAAVDWSVMNGLDELSATAYADNWRVLRLLSSTCHNVATTPADAGVVEVTIHVGDGRDQLVNASSR